jgi:hypothetical protein
MITPEPDPPLNTPRIGAVIRQRSAVIFSVAEIQGAIERRTTELPTGPLALAVQITYQGPAEEPVGSAPLSLLSSDEPIEQLGDDLWSSLSADLRVLLTVGTGGSVSGCRLLHQDP